MPTISCEVSYVHTQPSTRRPCTTATVAGDITYNPEPRRDCVRATIALSLIFALLIISGAALYSAHGDLDKTKELLDKLLPALTVLIGSVLASTSAKSSNS
jgi:hypothetical protein